jgi:hypothetical protein
VDSFTHPTLEAIPKPILEALELDMNLKRPSPIQALTVPLMIEGHSIIAQAQTGSGKTVAFAIGLLSRVDLKVNQVQCLVMAPTRELADQIVTDAVAPLAARYSPQVKVEKALAGNVIGRGAKSAAHVIVGTPGTIKSWISKKYFRYVPCLPPVVRPSSTFHHSSSLLLLFSLPLSSLPHFIHSVTNRPFLSSLPQTATPSPTTQPGHPEGAGAGRGRLHGEGQHAGRHLPQGGQRDPQGLPERADAAIQCHVPAGVHGLLPHAVPWRHHGGGAQE